MHESACVTGSPAAPEGHFGEGEAAALPEIGASSERGIPRSGSGPPVGLGRAVVSRLSCVTVPAQQAESYIVLHT